MIDGLDWYEFAYGGEECNWFWGSHGCSLEPNHKSHHTCIVTFYLDDDEGTAVNETCCQHDGTKVRWSDDQDGWGEWKEYGEGFALEPR